MTALSPRELVGVVAIAALGLALVFKICQREPAPKIPPKTQAWIDSLKVTAPAFHARADSAKRVVAQDTTIARAAIAKAKKAQAAADVAKREADSLAVQARLAQSVKDSANAEAERWRKAYEARTTEADALTQAVAQKDSAYQAERSARITLSIAYAEDTTRRVATEHVNADLQAAIARLQQPCKFGPFPCPSRTVTFVTTAVVTAIAVGSVHKP